MAIVGDIVSPRERGRYQGYFGGVFTVSSVAGPLIGGFFTEHLSWRWIFYINIPLGIVALIITSFVLRLNFIRRQAWWTTGRRPPGGRGGGPTAGHRVGRDLVPVDLAHHHPDRLGRIALVIGFVVWERHYASEPILPLRSSGPGCSRWPTPWPSSSG